MKKQYVFKGVSLFLILSLLLPSMWVGAVEANPINDGSYIFESATPNHVHDDVCTQEILDVDTPQPDGNGAPAMDKTDVSDPASKTEDQKENDGSQLIQTPVDAETTTYPDTNPDLINETIFQSELMAAAAFMGKDVSDISYSGVLKDAESRPIYLYVEFISGGYLIALRTHKMPLEYSRNAEYGPYSDRPDEENYYLGLLSYAYEQGGELNLVHSEESLSQEDLQQAGAACDDMFDRLEKNTVSDSQYEAYSLVQVAPPDEDDLLSPIVQAAASPPKVIDNNFFSGNTPFASNESGDCGPVAASLLMRYYDSKSPGLVDTAPNNHYDTFWKRHLQSFSSTGVIQGTIASDEADLINAYLGENRPDAGYQAKWALLEFESIRSLIDSDKPVVAYGLWPTITNGPHAVVAFGYELVTYDGISYDNLKIHTGWHTDCSGYNDKTEICSGGTRDDLFVSSYIIGSVLWLDTVSSGHAHNFEFAEENDQQHQYKCTGCELKKKYVNHAYSPAVEYDGYHGRTCTECSYYLKCTGNFSPTTCTTPKTCYRCGATIGGATGHSWKSATCTSPKTCSTCGATSGVSSGHSWSAATCTSPQTCNTCGAKSGSALGHTMGATWSEAEHPHEYFQNCSRCGLKKYTGETANKAHGDGTYGSGTCKECGSHSFTGATCTTASSCACGATGSTLGHSYTIAATCTSAKRCSRCSATSGSALGHSYTIAATCTSAAKCSRCSSTSGSSLGHSWGTTWSDASHPHAYYHNCGRCGTRQNTGGNATKSHGSGASGSGTCPSCGSHSYSGGTCQTKSKCACGATGSYGSHSFVTSGGVTRCRYCRVVMRAESPSAEDDITFEEEILPAEDIPSEEGLTPREDIIF